MPSDDGYEASPSVKQDDGSELYGSAFAQGVPQVTLAELLEHPDDYADKTVQTSGKVSRVCQNMGCWMELQDEQGAGELRAPLAGHSYFLPQSAIGKAATVQGTVSVRPLSEAQREHLEAEGAKATKAKVSIIADGVALR